MTSTTMKPGAWILLWELPELTPKHVEMGASMKGIFTGLCGLLVGGTLLYGQVVSPLPSFSVRPDESVESALLKLAIASKTPIGFEADGTGAPRVVNTRSVELSNLVPDKALPLLLGTDSPYRWENENGVVTIRPVDPKTGAPRKSWVDTKVSLDLKDVTLRDVADRLRLSFLRFKPPSPHPDMPRGWPEMWSRKFTAPGKGTIAEVLNAAILAHREATWSVQYVPVDRNDAPSVKLRFGTFDRSVFSMEMARPGSVISR